MRRRIPYLLTLSLVVSLVPVPLRAAATTTYVTVRAPSKVVSYARSMSKQGMQVWYPSKLPRGSVIESIRVFRVQRSQTTSAGTVCLVTVKMGTHRAWIWNGPRQIVKGVTRTRIPWGPYTARLFQQWAALRWTSRSFHSMRVNTSLSQLKVVSASMRVVR